LRISEPATQDARQGRRRNRSLRAMLHDPITVSVIQASLTAAADEMFAVLKKTAMSPIIYEVLDVGTGITDAAANWFRPAQGFRPLSACSTRRCGGSSN